MTNKFGWLRSAWLAGLVLVLLAGSAAAVFADDDVPPVFLPIIVLEASPTPTATVTLTPSPTATRTPSPTPTRTPTPTPAAVIYLPVVRSFNFVIPDYATSIYIQDESLDAMWNLGCAQGLRDRNLPGKQDSVIILDYGKMWLVNGQYTIRRFTNPTTGLRRNIPLSEVEETVKAYIGGYWICSSPDQESLLTVGVGTNNFDDMNVDGDPNADSTDQNAMRNAAYEFGRRFADLVGRLNVWALETGYLTRVTIVGANDIEWAHPDSGWNTPYVTRGWVEGFNANSRGLEMYINFGACIGCPIVPSLTWRFSAAMPWTQAEVWYVSWGAPPALPLPEIYRNDGYLARQWQAVSKYGALYLGGKMNFVGVMTQYQACQQRGGSDPSCETLDNTPEEGWAQMFTELNKDVMTAQNILRWVTDIKWQIR